MLSRSVSNLLEPELPSTSTTTQIPISMSSASASAKQPAIPRRRGKGSGTQAQAPVTGSFRSDDPPAPKFSGKGKGALIRDLKPNAECKGMEVEVAEVLSKMQFNIRLRHITGHRYFYVHEETHGESWEWNCPWSDRVRRGISGLLCGHVNDVSLYDPACFLPVCKVAPRDIQCVRFDFYGNPEEHILGIIPTMNPNQLNPPLPAPSPPQPSQSAQAVSTHLLPKSTTSAKAHLFPSQ